MSKIVFDYEGYTYTLEYTRRTVKQMQDNGFDLIGVLEKQQIVTGIPVLWHGAFLANHRHTKPELADKIWSQLPNKDEVVKALIEMFNEPAEQLFDEPAETEKNVEWKVVK